MIRYFQKSALLLVLAAFSGISQAQSFAIVGTNVKRYANDALSLMAFTVVPDLTSSFLSISSGNSENADLAMTQLAGGATVSQDLPIYLEGGVAYMRYDPEFVATNGTVTRDIPAKWNNLSGSGGLGLDFPIAKDLVFRPIFNFALGQVASDLSAGTRYLAWRTGKNIDFLDGGQMNAYGLGGSLMVDYESKTPEREIDVEWRYTNIQLKTFGNTSESVKGSASAEATSLYGRYRAPTGMNLLDRPLRYVLEAAHTTYLGSQRGMLGFNYMSSLGAGFELDSSAYDILVTRTRIVARYAFGENVRGFAVGLAVSF